MNENLCIPSASQKSDAYEPQLYNIFKIKFYLCLQQLLCNQNNPIIYEQNLISQKILA